jgi:putative oxygen-independent coproporphyrinogen III oxidase
MDRQTEPFSLYIHIPYCISKCPYCDFNSHVVPEIPETHYTDALLYETDRYAAQPEWTGRAIQTIFLGGGTPSTFKPASISRLLTRVAATFPIEPGCEITLEANPGTVDRENFSGYRDAGVNRISVGIQSFQPRLLKLLGRMHSADDARLALEVIKQAGFDNFNLDLIYASPSQTLAELRADLESALESQPPHLSAYNLTFEEGTPFHHELRGGRMRPADEDIEIAMAELIEARLHSVGLERYEISNYAQPDRRSRHNVNYWRIGDYLGLGAGAHSYCRNRKGMTGRRWSNEKNPGRYMVRIRESGQAVTSREDIEFTKAAGEFMFLGLRMTEGISCTAFRSAFGKHPVEFYPQIAEWIEGELIEERRDNLRLTQRGLLLANSIFVDFI